jgi:cytochrome c556
LRTKLIDDLAAPGRKTTMESSMDGPPQQSNRSRWRLALTATWLTASFLAPGFVAWGEDNGLPIAQDVILARKSLMNLISDNQDRINNMLIEHKIDFDKAHTYADNMAIGLTVFPHLFPASSNLWKEGAESDPVNDTIAAPDIWSDFQDFYEQATATAKIAEEIKQVDNEEDLRRLNRALGNACDLCHALYLKE